MSTFSETQLGSKSGSWWVKFIKKPQKYIGFMNVILSLGDHRHILAIHVAIFGVVRTRIQIRGIIICQYNSTVKKTHIVLQ